MKCINYLMNLEILFAQIINKAFYEQCFLANVNSEKY